MVGMECIGAAPSGLAGVSRRGREGGEGGGRERKNGKQDPRVSN